MRFRVRITGGFWLILLWFAAVNGWKMLAVVLSAAAIHEAGHCLVLKGFGARISGLKLSMLGAVLETNAGGLSYGAEILSALAGPAANFAAAWAGAVLRRRDWDVFTGANVVLCLFNLLPLRPLDGGRILALLGSWLLGPERGERLSRWGGTVSAACLVVFLGDMIRRTGGSLWLLPPLLGILVMGRRNCGKRNHIL